MLVVKKPSEVLNHHIVVKSSEIIKDINNLCWKYLAAMAATSSETKGLSRQNSQKQSSEVREVVKFIFDFLNFFNHEITFKISVNEKKDFDTNNNDSTTVDNDHNEIEIYYEPTNTNENQNIIKKLMNKYCLFFMHEHQGHLRSIKFTDFNNLVYKHFFYLLFRKKLQ